MVTLGECVRAVTFEHRDPEGVTERLLKPGAEAVFHDAVDAVKRPELQRRFLARLTERNGPGPARGGTGSARLTGRMECNGRGGRR